MWPDDYENTLISSMINIMQAGMACNLTEGTQLWDYLYLDDAVEAVIKMCYFECADGPYNLGSGDTRILREYVIELKKY